MSALIAEQTALKILSRVLQERHGLSDSFDYYQVDQLKAQPRAFCKQLCFGVMRYFVRLDAIIDHLSSKPIRKKDYIVRIILMLGLYQIIYLRTANHAAVNHGVELSRHCRKEFASRFINGVLRRFLREQSAVLEHVATEHACPAWIFQRLQKAWPQQAASILDAQNQQAPLSLCVNRQQISRQDYLNLLEDKGIAASACQFSVDGVSLAQAQSVPSLPGYEQAYFFVQDQAPQLAASQLDLAAGQKVLDACAAPGGKTAHILSLEPNLDSVLAVDQDKKRLQRLSENLQRLHFSAEQAVADLNHKAQWWHGELFDRILLDAPCSATGVIRRHPDIKFLRRDNDIKNLAAKQLNLLQSLWPCLSPGGLLLYATCSIFPEENVDVIAQFLKQTSDADESLINASWGIEQKHGRQILPGEANMDGFYYCRLQKK